VAKRLVKASQYVRGSGLPCRPSGVSTARGSGARTPVRVVNKASTSTGSATITRPARQPSPALNVAPTISGAIRPTPAAAALASLIAAGAAVPWWSVRAATMPLTASEPPKLARVANVRVSARWCAANMPTDAAEIRPRPSQISRLRPSLRVSAGMIAPPMMPPTAKPVPCRLARVRLMCNSSRRSGATGPKP
jgi:hypothetical protein